MLGYDLLAELGLKYGPAIIAGEYWRLITPVFLHGSIYHIFFNLYALYMIGRGLEKQYGAGRYLLLYFLAAFAGNVTSFIFSSAPSLGSSTAIFGLIGAQAVLAYQNRTLLGERYRPILVNSLVIAGINLVLGLSPGIDNWGHIGGLVGGSLFAWFAGPRWQVVGEYPRMHLEDQRNTTQVLLSALGVAFLFLAAATSLILTGG
jgi:rhomboid protease GluP